MLCTRLQDENTNLLKLEHRQQQSLAKQCTSLQKLCILLMQRIDFLKAIAIRVWHLAMIHDLLSSSQNEHVGVEASLQPELQASVITMQTVESALAQKASKVAELEAAVSEMTRINGQKHAQLDDLRSQVASFKEATTIQGTVYDKAQGKTTELEIKVVELQQQLAYAIVQGETAAGEHAALEAKLQSELQTAAGKQVELDSALARRVEEVAGAQLKVDELEAAVHRVGIQSASLQRLDGLLVQRFDTQIWAIHVWHLAVTSGKMHVQNCLTVIQEQELLYKQAASLSALYGSVFIISLSGAERKARAVKVWFDQCVDQQMDCINIWDPISPGTTDHQFQSNSMFAVALDDLEGACSKPDIDEVILQVQVAAVTRMLDALSRSTSHCLLKLIHDWSASCRKLHPYSLIKCQHAGSAQLALGLVLFHHHQKQVAWNTAMTAFTNWRLQTMVSCFANRERMNTMLWQLQMLGEENKTTLRDELFTEGYAHQVQLREHLVGVKALATVSRKLQCAHHHELLWIWWRASRFSAAPFHEQYQQQLQLVERCSLGASTSVLTHCLAWQRCYCESELDDDGIMTNSKVVVVEDVFTMDYNRVLFIERCSSIRRLAVLIQTSRCVALRSIFNWRLGIAQWHFELELMDTGRPVGRRAPLKRITRRTPR